MSEYQLDVGGGVTRLSDDSCIPPDPNNRDWCAYQEWLVAGGVPDAAPAPPEPTELELLIASANAKIANSGVLTQEEMAAIGVVP